MHNKTAASRFFPLVMGALVLWGVLLAVGSYLGPEFWAEPPAPGIVDTDTAAPQGLVRPFDYRKPLIVITFMLLFLALWAAALRLRQRRLDREDRDEREKSKSPSGPTKI